MLLKTCNPLSLHNTITNSICVNLSCHCTMFTFSIFSVRENAYILLSPYLRFVLLEPQQSPQFMQCRLALLPACLKIGAKDENIVTRTLAFFIDILPCLQVGLERKIHNFLWLLYPRREAGILWIHHRCRPRPRPRPQRFLVSDLQSTFLSRFLSYLAGGLIW